MNKCTPFIRQCFVTAAVCSNCIGQGCLIGFPAVLLPQLFQPDSGIIITKDQASWIAAVSSISMVFGNFMISPVMEHAGRKVGQYTVSLVMLLGWPIMALAKNIEGLLIGKVLQGLAFGMLMPLRSILVGEYTSPCHRGGFLSLISFSKSFGILFVHLVGSVTSYKTTAVISMAFPLASLLMMLYSPESPSWLAMQGKHSECKKAFIWLRGMNEIPELEGLIQASKILSDKKVKQNRIHRICAIVKKKELYKPIILVFAMFFMMNFAGGTLMGAYAVTVLNLLLGPGVNAHVWMVAMDAVRLFFSVVSIYVTNRFKRRTLTFFTAAISVGSMLGLAAYVFIKTKDLLPWDSLWVPGVLISLQALALGLGTAPLPSVVAGEVFPLQHRGLGGSVSLISVCASIFLVLKTFPALQSCVGLHGVYFVHSGIMLMFLVVIWFTLPETSGKTLQEIEEHFRGERISHPETDAEAKSFEGLVEVK
ncbi:facilitated trehalose transporter Tret1-2 homolog [Leguminivora glycinivorella]|uniref:facilitated trehalose transporter Tret1-2 homolog n=1 Tax=Leguminivora glycinivorella TaxID=1035111 RepID=UPI00200C1D6E|nr:facilitated trehalose transporter Tret1-2 homolog [Leguminivora glycinivorella]